MNQETKTPADEAANNASEPAENDSEVKATQSPEVSVLLAKIEEYKEGWQRERADFANYKRRAEREQSEARSRGAQDTVLKMVPIIDDLELGLGIAPEEIKANPWFSGIELLITKFDKLLADLEVEKIDPTGEVFDPTKHNGIGVEDKEGVPSGHVSSTLQKGYISGDRVLRPALVRVAR